MQTSGIFFLRSRPASIRLTSPTDGWVPGWMLLLGERTGGKSVNTFRATWRGTEADQFIQAHPGLTAGHCLYLELDRLHAVDGELVCRVTRCDIAPPRWPEQADEPEAVEPAITFVAECARVAGVAA